MNSVSFTPRPFAYPSHSTTRIRPVRPQIRRLLLILQTRALDVLFAIDLVVATDSFNELWLGPRNPINSESVSAHLPVFFIAGFDAF
jgi:hypothetical protein